MNATSRFLPSASSPSEVDEPSASTSPSSTLSPSWTIGFWWISVPWFEHELHELVAVVGAVAGRDHDRVRVDGLHDAGPQGDLDVAGVDGGAVLEPGADGRRLRDQQRHR